MLKLAVLIGLVAVVASSLDGGFEKVSSLEDAQKLAQWSTSHPSVKGLLNFEDATVAQVVEAQRQLVNGLNYRIKFNVIGRNQDDNKYAAKQCYLELYVSFADERQVKSVNCEDNLDFFGKQPYDGEEIEGGEESYQLQIDLAKWVVNEHKKMAVNQFNAPDADLMQVKKFTRQVVAGMKYRLTFSVLARRADNKYQSQECDAEIWDRPWLNLRLLQSITCQDTNEIKPVEYDGIDLDPGTVEFQTDLANWVIKKQFGGLLPFSTPSAELLQVKKIRRELIVTSLITSYDKYSLTFSVLIRRDDKKYQSQECDAVVTHRPMLYLKLLQSITCKDINEVVGQTTEQIDPPSVYSGEGGFGQPGAFQKMQNNQKSQELAQWVAEQPETKQALGETVERIIILKVEPAEAQIIAGINYRFKVDVLLQSNEQPPKYKFQRCNVEVYERAWENVRYVTAYQCAEFQP